MPDLLDLSDRVAKGLRVEPEARACGVESLKSCVQLHAGGEHHLGPSK